MDMDSHTHVYLDFMTNTVKFISEKWPFLQQSSQRSTAMWSIIFLFIFIFVILDLIREFKAYSVKPIDLNVRAWKTNATYLSAEDFPETRLPELLEKPSTALCFSGGGSRAMIGAFGFLAGLRDLGLLDKIRYIGGISGGSWATTLYCYSDVANDDGDVTFLGPIMEPAEITEANLRNCDPNCVRRLSSRSFLANAYPRFLYKKMYAWIISISKCLLEPFNIHRGKLYSWNLATVDDIIDRNPNAGLRREDFLLPRHKNGPFFVIGWSIVGPQQGWFDPPLRRNNNHADFFEATPLYVGTMRTFVQGYRVQKTPTVMYGGVIEPYAFAMRGGKAPEAGLSNSSREGILKVPKPKEMLDLTNVTSTSSLAPSSMFESVKFFDIWFDWVYDYWSPAMAEPVCKPVSFSDGGYAQNIPLCSFIQREVEHIVVVSIGNIPFNYDKIRTWRRNNIGADDFDFSVAAFFGILPDERKNDAFDKQFGFLYAYDKMHVFETCQFQWLIDDLKEAHDRGTGMFSRRKYTTVENETYKIPAGREVDVTFYYNSICNKWLDQLDEGLAEKVSFKSSDRTCFQKLFNQHFEYSDFPHYAVDDIRYTRGESNILANMTGWAVKQNEELMRDIFS